MAIEVFTLCWNEMAILPYAVDYWKKFASKVTVYDNGSTDGSVEFLRKQGSWIEVREFDTHNRKDNTAHMVLKNKMWKEARGRAELVCVCDLDEFLIFKNDAAVRMVRAGGTICEPAWYELVSDKTPEYTKGKLLHELRPFAAMPNVSQRMPTPSKAVLFDPNKITDINYGPGSHRCDPKGDVRFYGGDIYVLHVNNALSFSYRLKRYHQQRARLSVNDVAKGYGRHYGQTDEQIKQNWIALHRRMVNFGEILK